MKRFEVWRLRSAKSKTSLVMILQSERIDQLNTIVVAPLRVETGDEVIPCLTPKIVMADTNYVVLIPFLAAIERKDLLEQTFDANQYAYEITQALDRLLTGV